MNRVKLVVLPSPQGQGFVEVVKSDIGILYVSEGSREDYPRKFYWIKEDTLEVTKATIVALPPNWSVLRSQDKLATGKNLQAVFEVYE